MSLKHLSPRSRRASSAFAALAALMLTAPSAQAAFKLRYPIVDYREFEIEHNGATTFDKANSGKSNNQSFETEFGIGILPNWFAELELESEAPPGENLSYEATTFENIFQLTPQGKYWADLGFFAEYSHAASRHDADSIKFGPLVQKEVSDFLGTDTLHTLNLLFEKEVGHNRTDATQLSFAWQSRFLVDPLFQPGVELFSEIDDLGSPGKLAEQEHRIGPMFAGEYNMFNYGKIKYELGYLFGLTHATENGAVIWRFEYEIPF